MARRLKVYRTVAGFHDAYVAAPSQTAALAAWGSEKDLFARGDAELVEDPDLTAAPLADPGTVIRLSRGTTAAQIAAMPDRSPPGPPTDDDATPDDRGARRSDTDRGSPATPPKPPSPKPKPTPKPSPANCAIPEAVKPEANNSRPYDNVNDYVGAFDDGSGNVNATPYATDAAGNAFPPGYAATVSITPDNAFGPAGAQIAPADGTPANMNVLRITVRVVYGADVVVLDGYRTRYAPRSL